jgi:hypothetical protein
MIEVLPETSRGLIALKLVGTVTEDDMDQAFAKMEDVVVDQMMSRLLLDWSELEDWAKGARSVGTWFGMHHWATVQRIAIVAGSRWEDERLRIVDIFKAATVRRFDPNEREDAFAWIREN